VEPLYELDIVLLTLPDHPLARQRHVRPQDLSGYPLVNAANAILDPATMALLERAGASVTQPHLVEAYFTASIRCYVELGFGIGLAPALPGRPPARTLHERDMSRYFGCLHVYQLQRRGTSPLKSAVAFTDLVRAQLRHPPTRPRRAQAAPHP
jgi:DNA-binding transcriptional LysR family regulator